MSYVHKVNTFKSDKKKCSHSGVILSSFKIVPWDFLDNIKTIFLIAPEAISNFSYKRFPLSPKPELVFTIFEGQGGGVGCGKATMEDATKCEHLPVIIRK